MDPDGLSIFSAFIGGVLVLALTFSAGAAYFGEKDDEAFPLGFSKRMAGILSCLVFAGWLYVFGLTRIFSKNPLWLILCAAVTAAVVLLTFALGIVRGRPSAKSKLSAIIGAVFALPARAVFAAAKLSAQSDVTEEDLLNMVDDVEEQELIDENQKEMITNIFELDDVTAGDIMTHRTEISAVPSTALTGEAVRIAAESGVSRLPVYGKSMDDIVGFLYVKDLLDVWTDHERSNRPVTEFLRPAMFVPETCRAKELLVDFKVKHMQIAVVVDEYGGTSGLATMEDILEEIVGNIQDEFDDEEDELVLAGDGTLTAAGSADLEDVFEAFGEELPDDDEREFDTVGGLVIDSLGRIPASGENPSVEYRGLEFTVTEVSDRRVARVKCARAAKKDAAKAPQEAENGTF